MTYPPPYEQQPGAKAPSSSPPTTPYPTYLGPPAPPPKRSNGPILAVVIVLAVLLLGGTATAGVLLVNRSEDPGTVATDRTTDPATPRPEQTTPEAGDDDDNGSDSDNDGNSGGKVVYEVTGDGPVSIVFLKEDGLTPERASDTDLPWRKEQTLDSGAALVTVTAIRSGGGTGSIECRITIDGEEVAKKTATGTYATVTCNKLIL
ncbi:MmpS family transport accessory protein [Phytohabitans kaempferiae]|uniref:MmpS family transport accessory protein n=1 Tax=Phytohabitans kaempferiae TaxID=1620943 RepID=A0ABV6LVJ7_9ACTN